MPRRTSQGSITQFTNPDPTRRSRRHQITAPITSMATAQARIADFRISTS
jgi:hypothetical protein